MESEGKTMFDDGKEDEGYYRYVVAIDFGTARTGFAWCVKDASSSDGSIHYNMFWSGNQKSVKGDSWLETDERSALLSYGRLARKKYVNWSLTRNRTYDFFYSQRVKMDLYDIQSNVDGGYIDDYAYTIDGKPVRKINNRSFSSLKLVELFLSEMKREAMKAIGTQDPNEIQWVVTVPASASTVQKNWMREAALNVGIIESKDSKALLIALEPEAALISIHKREESPEKLFSERSDDPIKQILARPHIKLIVDAGGGTVDVAAYQCTEGGGFNEVANTRAANVGSTNIDIVTFEFLKLCIFPLDLDYDDPDVKSIIAELYDDIERSKEAYDPSNGQDVVLNTRRLFDYCRAPEWDGDPLESTMSGVIVDKNTGETIISRGCYEKQVCAPVYHDASKPIREALEQIDQNDKKNLPVVVYFVGGLGCSKSFFTNLKKNIDVSELIGKGRQIEWAPLERMTDHERQGAVLEGAVMFGDKSKRLFASRISRYMLGIKATCPYSEKYAQRKYEKYFSDQYNMDYISNVFSSFVSIGDSVNVGETRGQVYEVGQDKENVRIRLFYTEKRGVLFTDERDVYQLGEDCLFTLWEPVGKPRRKVIVEARLGETEIEITVHERAFPENRLTFVSPKLLNAW